MDDALQQYGLTPVTASLLGDLALLLVVLVLLLRTGGTRRPGGRAPAGLDRSVALRWTTHVRERMEQRRISADEVETSLRTPDRCQADPGQRSMRFEKDFQHRTVRVWVAAQPWPPVGEVVIKTTAAQYLQSVRIRRDQVGKVIGRGGSTIRHLQATTQARINVDRDGTVQVRAGEPEHVQAGVREVVRVARSR